jgi:D-alanine-D-alanine ligase
MQYVIVLAGGNSDEREISLRSGAAVAAALTEAGYETDILDPSHNLESRIDDLRKAVVVFPALHGLGGEDGELQAFLEEHKIPFVGSGSEASALCFDKERYTHLMEENDITVPATDLVDESSYAEADIAGSPHVLKPNDGGSSIDTFIIRDIAATDDGAIVTAFGRHSKMLLQELIDGTELTVAVIGDKALPVIEIVPPENQEFDYENKYNGATREICPPETIPPAAQERASRLAERIHVLTGCRDMSRTDMILTDDDELYVLETNTIPGLTNASLLPKAAATAGLSMPQLCDQLVQTALLRQASSGN